MAVNLSPVFGVAGQLFDNNGNPLAGGKIYTYLAGTTTNAATYTNSSGSIAHSNPIVLDGAGRVPSGEIWLTDGITYKFVVEDSANNLIGTYDNLVGINSNFVAYTSQQEIQSATAGQTVFNLATMQYQPGTNNLSVFVDGVNQYGPGAQYAFVETDADTVTFVSGLHVGASVKFTTASPVASNIANAENIAYDPPYIGAITTNVEEKLAEVASVKDFGAVGDGVIDDYQAFQDALNSGARQIYIPQGYYKIGTTLVVPATVSIIYGAGVNASRLWSNTANANYIFNLTGASVSLRDFRIYGGDQENSPFTIPTGRYGLNATGTGNQFAWERLAIYGFDIGASVGALASTVYMCLFSHIDVAVCNTGIRVDQGMHQSSWLNCQFRACVNYGLKFDPTGADFEIVANGIYNCTFERISGTGAALYLRNVRGIDVSACYFEGNKGNSLYITGTPTNGSQGVSVHNCYFFEYAAFHTPPAGGYGIQVVGPHVDGVSITNNHFEDYNTATFYPIRLVDYAGDTTFIHNNVFNNSTYQIQSDYGYQLNDYGGINNHVIVRKQGRTNGSGNLAALDLGQLALGNASAQLFLQVTMVRCTDDMTAVDATSVIRMKAAVSGSTVVLVVGAGSPTGVTFSVGSTTTLAASYLANLRVTIAGGDVDTNIGFVVETAYTNNAKLGGLSTIPETYS